MTQNEKSNPIGKLTWGDLKLILENAGIADKDELDRIDISWGTPDEIEVTKDEDFGWQIYL